jgi:hypothetical protein
MTKLLERAIEAARSLPAESQDEIARVVLQLAGGDVVVVPLSDNERAALAVESRCGARGIRERSRGARRLGQARPVRVRYTRPALDDLEAILKYIETHFPRGAPSAFGRISRGRASC